MISRVRLGDDFFGAGRAGVERRGRDAADLRAMDDGACAIVDGGALSRALASGGSDEGGSLEGVPGFNGVWKGDLKGL